MNTPLRVTVWNEFRHERHNEKIKSIYPQGMHAPIAAYLKGQGMEVRTATLDEPEHGLSEATLAATDVLTWWGHGAHQEVQDEIVERVHRRVLDGMGLVVLHSGHFSKIFQKLMGTTCNLKWREADETERLWAVQPGHPICRGIGEYIELEAEEMYGEFFDIPQPDELIFVSWFEGGEVFRSGATWTRGRGKIFYFRPGHESYPTYHNEQILRVIANGAQWAGAAGGAQPVFGNVQPLQAIAKKDGA
jgi:trehalose utilization protein